MSDSLIEEIKRLNAKFIELTGREAFGYLSKPTPTSERWTFGDGTVCTSGREAYAHMVSLVATAATVPETLPYPFDQPLTPDQDLRNAEPR